MKIIVLITFMTLAILPTLVSASPYLVSDPSSDNATSCVFESFPVACSLDGAKAIKVDLASLSAGTYSGIRAAFCFQGGLWCSGWSLPFTFTKPTLPVAPAGMRLLK